LALAATVGTHEATHVLNYSQNRSVSFFAEIDFFANIGESNFLGSGYDYCSVHVCFLEVLDHRYVLVTGAGGSVDHQVVQFIPKHVGQELLY
jgi:hypothetical protein